MPIGTFIRATGALSSPGDAPVVIFADIASGLLAQITFDGLRESVADGGVISSVSTVEGSVPVTLGTAPGSLTKPTLRHSGPGGHAALSFSGTNGVASVNAASAPLLAAQGTPMTMVAVVKATWPSGDWSRVITPSYISGWRGLGVNGSGAAVAAGQGVSSTLSVTSAPATIPTATWGVVAARTTSSATSAFAGGLAGSDAGDAAGAFRGICLGANPAGASPLIGELADVRLFGRALTNGDIAALTAELKATYGIA